MLLYHYSAEPFVLDAHRRYRQNARRSMMLKPAGLWLSVESEGDGSYGWRDWCEAESFHLDALAYRTRVALRPDANVLHLDTDAALLAFSQRYERPLHESLSMMMPDWIAVARDYQGLIIAPYSWDLRLDLFWYYGWDCASGCIWDCSTLDVRESTFRPAASASDTAARARPD